jgi:eukaryotic-like serine/threonine-protein kinase
MKFLESLFSKKPKIDKVDLQTRFELITRIGQGSMSKVWKAMDRISGQIVVVKVLDKAKLIRLDRRFVGMNKPTEGQIAVTLRHKNIVRTLEHGVTKNVEQFLVMEYIEGKGLSYYVDVQNQRMKQHRLNYMIQLGDAIDYLHRQRWIHRDICPRNMIVDEHDTLKLIDFGLVVPNTEPFRAPGNRTGTAAYMAPELIKRLRTDERIDVFSYAVTCYEVYTRQMPWDTGDTLESVMQAINKPPRDIRKLVPKLDEQIARTIMEGLERSPDDRWQSAAAMADEFREAKARLEARHAGDK